MSLVGIVNLSSYDNRLSTVTCYCYVTGRGILESELEDWEPPRARRTGGDQGAK